MLPDVPIGFRLETSVPRSYMAAKIAALWYPVPRKFIEKGGVSMKILGLGVPELLIILVVVLLIFGPKNLPKLGNALGKTVKGLRDGMGAGKKKDVTEAADNAQNVEDAEVLEEVVEDEPAKPTPKASSPKKVKKVVVKKAE